MVRAHVSYADADAATVVREGHHLFEVMQRGGQVGVEEQAVLAGCVKHPVSDVPALADRCTRFEYMEVLEQVPEPAGRVSRVVPALGSNHNDLGVRDIQFVQPARDLRQRVTDPRRFVKRGNDETEAGLLARGSKHDASLWRFVLRKVKRSLTMSVTAKPITTPQSDAGTGLTDHW